REPAGGRVQRDACPDDAAPDHDHVEVFATEALPGRAALFGSERLGLRLRFPDHARLLRRLVCERAVAAMRGMVVRGRLGYRLGTSDADRHGASPRAVVVYSTVTPFARGHPGRAMRSPPCDRLRFLAASRGRVLDGNSDRPRAPAPGEVIPSMRPVAYPASMRRYVAPLDQGTPSCRCIVSDHGGRVAGIAQPDHEQILPHPGCVE